MGRKILLVEDHDDSRRMMQLLLQREGHFVRSVSTAGEALAQLRIEPFDLILSDIGLPDMSGHLLMKQVRNKYHIPGIAMSGYTQYESGTASRDAGFFAHVTKPVDVMELMTIIRTVG